jgi:hypothetical protein
MRLAGHVARMGEKRIAYSIVQCWGFTWSVLHHQLSVLLHWRRRSDWQFLYYNPNHTSLQSLTIISYAVTRLHNYNPYTFVTTIVYYTRTHLHWLTSQLSITVSNYHTLPVSVSYRDLTRRTAPYKLIVYRRGPSGYLLCTDSPKTAAILLSCVSDILATVIALFRWRLRGDEP